MINTTDDDDISIFVQEIDSRKPLSGRMKQLEEYVGDPVQDFKRKKVGGQRHDRGATFRAATIRHSETIAAKVVHTPGTDSPVIQPDFPPPSPAINPIESTSPPRGMMLTSQGEVDERLTKMKEAFLKSLEGFGSGNEGDTHRKDKDKETSSNSGSACKTQSTAVPFPRSSPLHSGFSLHGDVLSLASRGTFTSREQRLGRTGYNMGLESRSSQHSSTSSSALGSSGIVRASQSSQEVIGQMDLYDEKRRR